MASDEAAAPPSSPRRRLLPLAILLAGGVLLAYFASSGPRDQHLRLVLGDAAPGVSALSVQYAATKSGEVAREVRLTYGADGGGAAAPRVVALEPRLPDGDYRLRIDVDTREGRRTTERQVTLGGGTTSVDLSGLLVDKADKRTTP